MLSMNKFKIWIFINMSIFYSQVLTWKTFYDYLLADFGICNREKPDVVVWIQGRANGTAHRPILRELIANERLWPPDLNILTLFFVGRPGNRSLQNLIEYEYQQYKDIVQNDYIDHYRNQTAKLISAITYLADYCGMSKLAIRLDDDVILNPARMIAAVISLMQKNDDDTESQHSAGMGREIRNLLPHHNLQQNSVLCHFFDTDKLINRNLTSEFYGLDYRFLPHLTYYPEYCAGYFIAFTSDLLPKFRDLFKIEEPFWIDDAYLGILQQRIGTRHVRTDGYFHFFWGRYDGNLKTVLDTTDVTVEPQTRAALAVHLTQEMFNFILGHFGFLRFENQ